MTTLFLVLKIIFVLFYLGILSYMANYFFRKSGWSRFYYILGVLAVIGIIITGQAFIVRAYNYFSPNEALPLVLGISRFLVALFFVIVNVLSYYMYIAYFNKKRYQNQQNVVWILTVLSIILVALPQNDYAKDAPGLLLPRLRVIPSIICGLYISLILMVDSYYKRNAQFQHYALCLFLLQLVQIVNSYFLKAKAKTEFIYYAMICVIFIAMLTIFYRELYKKNELERF